MNTNVISRFAEIRVYPLQKDLTVLALYSNKRDDFIKTSLLVFIIQTNGYPDQSCSASWQFFDLLRIVPRHQKLEHKVMDEQVEKQVDEIGYKKQRRERKVILLIGGLFILTGVLLSLGLAAYSFAQDAPPEVEDPGETAAFENLNEPEAFLRRFSGITAEAMPFWSREAVEEALETAVGNGVLTAEESAAILADIEEQAAAPLGGAEFSIAGAEPVVFAGPLGFIRALEAAIEEGTLTEADLEAILADFEALVGDTVTIERSPDNRTVEEGETSYFFNDLRIEINGLAPEAVVEAIGQALDNAVASGRLTAEEAEAIRAQAEEINADPWTSLHIGTDEVWAGVVEALPIEGLENFHFKALPEQQEGAFGRERLERFERAHLLARLEWQLSAAVEAGQLTQAEADQLLESLRGALSETAE
jgi:hypothetical protein